jgi:hypothetical protein
VTEDYGRFGGSPPSSRPTAAEYRQVWDDVEYEWGISPEEERQYHDQLELFLTLSVHIQDEDKEDQLDAWYDYILAWVTDDESDRRVITKDHRGPWWHDMAISDRDFDWAAWRQARGYRSKE